MDTRRQILGYTDHCRQRMAQRNVREGDIAFILAHGAMVHRTGVVCFTLTGRSIPPAERGTRLSLTSVVVLVKDGWVITVYRNRRPLRHIRHKVKYHDRRIRAEISAPAQQTQDEREEFAATLIVAA